MTFFIQADVSGTDAASVVTESRDEAFEIARRWLKSGQRGVKVIGDGRIHLPPEFDDHDPDLKGPRADP
jgi:hypothetical protein